MANFTNSAKLLKNEKLSDDVGLHLDQCVNYLSALDSEAEAEEAVLTSVRDTASNTMELVRKCMKLAIELIEAEAEGNKNFMEYLHSEPDLILHCQEIESYCNNLLPPVMEKEGMYPKHSEAISKFLFKNLIWIFARLKYLDPICLEIFSNLKICQLENYTFKILTFWIFARFISIC